MKLAHFLPKYSIAFKNNQVISKIVDTYRKVLNPTGVVAHQNQPPQNVPNPAVDMTITAKGPMNGTIVATVQTGAGAAQLGGDIDLEAGASITARIQATAPEVAGHNVLSGNLQWGLPNIQGFQDGVLKIERNEDLDNNRGSTTAVINYRIYKNVQGMATFEPF